MMRLLCLLAATLLLGACTEKLTAPGECPGLCPSDNLEVRDTVITATRDSGYVGFVPAGGGSRLLAANGYAGLDLIPIIRFARAVDSITIEDTLRPAVLDSVMLFVTVTLRDPAATGLALEFFKLPAAVTTDSGTTHAEVAAALTPERLVASVPLPDTLTNGEVRVVLAGADLARLAFAPEDDKVLRLAYRLQAPTPTGIGIASQAGGSAAPGFVSFMRVVLPDTTISRTIPRTIQYGGFVTSAPANAPSPDELLLGGWPSRRAILRFDLSPMLRDTARIIRATLELTPSEPIAALPGDTARLDVRGVFSDLGPKSPRISGTGGALILTTLLTNGSAAPVMVEVSPIATLWTSESGVPPVLMVTLAPEAATFGTARFGSSRVPGLEPRLRLTFAMPYPFEVQ
jgi:hypothetical protein